MRRSWRWLRRCAETAYEHDREMTAHSQAMHRRAQHAEGLLLKSDAYNWYDIAGRRMVRIVELYSENHASKFQLATALTQVEELKGLISWMWNDCGGDALAMSYRGVIRHEAHHMDSPHAKRLLELAGQGEEPDGKIDTANV